MYVKLHDGRGWVFETLQAKKVLMRVTPSATGSRPALPNNVENGREPGQNSGGALAEDTSVGISDEAHSESGVDGPVMW